MRYSNQPSFLWQELCGPASGVCRDKAAVRQAVGPGEAEAAARVRTPGQPLMGEQVVPDTRRAGRSVVEVGGALQPVRCAHLSLSGARYVLATSYSVVWGSTPCATLVFVEALWAVRRHPQGVY